MSREGAIVTEPQYICDVCGKKKPVSQMAGKCVKCGKYVCTQCSRMKEDKVYCEKCAGRCFIATAAYGTAMATELNALREFRDRNLNPNILGRNLVRFYYRISPSLASVIASNENMRALVRFNLNPIVYTLRSRQRQED